MIVKTKTVRRRQKFLISLVFTAVAWTFIEPNEFLSNYLNDITIFDGIIRIQRQLHVEEGETDLKNSNPPPNHGLSQLCHRILDNDGGVNSKRDDDENLISEPRPWCTTDTDPYESVLRIVRTASLAERAKRYNLFHGDYLHKCNELDSSNPTIQMALPSTIMAVQTGNDSFLKDDNGNGNGNGNGIDSEEVIIRECQDILDEEQKNDNINFQSSTLQDKMETQEIYYYSNILAQALFNLHSSFGLLPAHTDDNPEYKPHQIGDLETKSHHHTSQTASPNRLQSRRLLKSTSSDLSEWSLFQKWNWSALFRNIQRKSRFLIANDFTDAPSHHDDDVTIIYIDDIHMHLDDDTESHFQALPLYLYASHIPRSVTNVYIIPSKKCTNRNYNSHDNQNHDDGMEVSNSNTQSNSDSNCMQYAQLLAQYITALVPRASISIIHSLSSKEAWSRIIQAQTLICPSGTACLLPALLRSFEHYVQQNTSNTPSSPKSTILVNHGMQQEYIQKELPTSFLKHLTILPQSLNTHFDSLNANLNLDYHDSLHHSPNFISNPRSICPTVRGRLGKWVQDYDFAKHLQYTNPLEHIFGFADMRFEPTEQEPYRLPTTQRWQEDTITSACPITIFNKQSFCKLMNELGIGRIFFVGDFVGMNQAYSLWKLLEHDDLPKPLTNRTPAWQRTINCPYKDTVHDVLLQYERNDKLIENNRPVDLPNGIRNCQMAYCYNWSDQYRAFHPELLDNNANNSNDLNPHNLKSLMIFSFGPHFYSENEFSTQADNFLSNLKEVMGERLGVDTVFYRNTVPGHAECNKYRANNPFKNFEQYRPTITSDYSWDLHDGFNDIMDRKVREFNYHISKEKNQLSENIPISSTGPGPVRILDVYPMTVLRQDGHIGGRDCRNCKINNDCFHYSLPGPTDWWNHLMLSNLADDAGILLRGRTNTASILSNQTPNEQLIMHPDSTITYVNENPFDPSLFSVKRQML